MTDVSEFEISVVKRRFLPEDAFFHAGNIDRELRCKFSVISTISRGEYADQTDSSFPCSEPNCASRFFSVFEYESHYERCIFSFYKFMKKS